MTEWKGRGLIYELHLRQAEIDEITRLISTLLLDKPIPNDRFFDRVSTLGRKLPRRLRAEIARFHRDRHYLGLQVRGYPVDRRLVTPSAHVGPDANIVPVGPEQVYHALLASRLGEPIAWTTQQDGAFFNNVFPIKENENKVISSGSAKSLDLHTEDAGLYPHLPDYLGLICLRNPNRVPTSVASFDPKVLGRRTIEVLFQARFYVGLNIAHAMQRPPTSGAVFFGRRRFPMFRVNMNSQSSLPGDAEAADAIDKLSAELRKNCFDVVLNEGDCFFLKNKFAAHGRGPYQPQYDGKDRWLQRLTIVRKLEDFSDIVVAPQTRVFNPALSNSGGDQPSMGSASASGVS